MDAVIVDLKDLAVRTPEQVVRIFYELYHRETVKTGLWNLFISMAICGKKDNSADNEAKLALLIDHLISLVDAVEKLRAGDTDARHCAICGSKRKNGSGKGQ